MDHTRKLVQTEPAFQPGQKADVSEPTFEKFPSVAGSALFNPDIHGRH